LSNVSAIFKIVKTQQYLAITALLAFLSIPAFAQTNKIDSMMVDERRNQLLLYGDFSARSGAVTVDSVSMPIVEWETTWIRCIVPKSGRGWAGPVVVGGGGVRGPARMLTGYSLGTNYENIEWLNYSNPGGLSRTGTYQVDENWTIALRLDLVYLLSKPERAQTQLEAINYSSQGSLRYRGDLKYSEYNKPGITISSIWEEGNSTAPVIDSLNLSEGARVEMSMKDSLLSVIYPPISILIKETTLDGTSNQSDVRSYAANSTSIRVRYKINSEFVLVPEIMDSIVHVDAQLVLTPGQTYERTFNTVTSLPQFPPDRIVAYAKPLNAYAMETMSVFPNPIVNKSSISITLPNPQRVNIYVSDILGRTVQTFSEGLRSAGTHLISFDTSKLPCGVYLCNMNTANGNRTVRITIVH
jgi:hypothetical protein